MNREKDFHKKQSGVIVNTNTRDFRRAKKRNFVRREQDKIFGIGGEEGKISKLERELNIKNDDIDQMKQDIEELKLFIKSSNIKRG